MQQQNNDQQPGSVAGKMSLFNILLEYYWFIIFVAAMVRKLYEAHQVRSEVLNHWNKPEDPFQSYRRNSYSSKVNLIWKHKGKGVKIGFGNWFLFVSFKVRIPDEVQCPTKRWRWRVDFVRFTSLPEMPLIIFSNIFFTPCSWIPTRSRNIFWWKNASYWWVACSPTRRKCISYGMLRYSPVVIWG